MAPLCPQGYPPGLVYAAVVAAWASGTLFGWTLRKARRRVHKPSAARAQGTPYSTQPSSGPARSSRRHGGYYFSEETRSWGYGRWRRRAGWALLAILMSALGSSIVIAAVNYKPVPAASPLE